MCIKTYIGMWMYKKAYGYIWANVTVYESLWSYMNVNGSKRMYTKVYEAMWWYRDLIDGVWVSMRPYGGI